MYKREETIMASKIDELRKLHADKMLDADELDNIAGGTQGRARTTAGS